MNQSIYDITDVVGIELQPVRTLLGCDATANYLRNLTRIALKAISNPSLYLGSELAGVIQMQDWGADSTGLAQHTAEVFDKLYRFLKAQPIDPHCRLLTIVDVRVTPVSYHLTLGHVA